MYVQIVICKVLYCGEKIKKLNILKGNFIFTSQRFISRNQDLTDKRV